MTVKPDNVSIQEYEIILKSNTLNNNSDNEKSIFVYRHSNVTFIWHEFDKCNNVYPTSPGVNINVVNWVHRINYYSDLANDRCVKKIYPDYSHAQFVDLFCQYSDTTDE